MSPDKKVIGARLREVREAPPYWSRAELARRLRAAADPRDRAAMPHVASLADMIKQWEAGKWTPNPRYRALYTCATGRTESELFEDASRPPGWSESVSVPGDVDDPVMTVELARRLRLSDVDRPTLETLAAVTESLCTQYAYRAPGELRTEAHRWFAYVEHLLGKRVGLYEHRELLVTAGWLALLTGCLEYDSGLAAAAEGTRRSALQLGSEAGHSEIIAWALEMAAWFAHTQREPDKTVMYAQAGQEAAQSAGVAVQLVAHEARALARMSDVKGVHEALERGHALLSRMPRPSNPRNHFVVDPDKFDFYAMDAYRVVGANDRAAAHAAEVLRTGRGPDGEDLAPMRMAEARITLAAVAARAGDLEEAVERGRDALGADRKCLPSLLLVAGELQEEISERYPGDQAAREFSEHLHELRHPPAP